ncbi:MAG: Slp family lipoprotein [Nitrosospira sp.]|nr:Slp family lipoprotein [Nitrosospira sp.]
MKRYVLVTCLLLGACSGLPDRLQSVPVTDVTYKQASQNLSKHDGKSVRWGGVIVKVENEQNFTLVQVLSYPLSYYGRPETRERSHGRFVIKSTKFLDPAVYEAEREITVAGTIKGDIERTIDDKTVRIPLLLGEAVYLWPYNYGYYPYYWGYYGPYWY